MQLTDHGLKKPAGDDFYNVEDFNDNTQILEEHLSDNNVHINAEEISEIKEPAELTPIDSTDTNSTLWGKVKKAINELILHKGTTASTSILGHIKIGTGLQISNGTASVNLNPLINKIYPIGAIYMSANDISPADFIGGAWERFGVGRTLISVNPNDDSYNTAEKTGGSATTTLSTSNMPAHAHSFSGSNTPTGSANTSVSVAGVGNHYHGSGALTTGTTSLTGGFGNIALDQNNAISTEGVFSQWKSSNTRSSSFNTDGIDFAYLDASHNHSVTGTTDWGGAHSHSASASTSISMNNLTISGTTGSSGSGTAFSNLQPYTTVYMWKRTA